MQFEKWYDIDLKKPRHFVPDLGFPTFEGDSNSVRIGVNVYSDKAEETVTGTIKGYVILPNGVALVPFDGASDGNRAWIDLPDDALVMEGRIKVSIRCFDGDETTVLFQASATVCRVDSTAHYDPDDEVGDITDLIEEAERVSGVAAQAASDAQAALAQASDIVSYAEQTGQTDAQKAQARANIGAADAAEVSDLKSAIDEMDFETKTVTVTPISHVNYRYGYLDGELISSNGTTAWEFDAEPNRDYVLQGLQVGTNNTYAVLFIDSSNNVLSIVNDATQETGHLVPIKTPLECVKVKYSSSTNATWDASPKKVVYKTIAEQSSIANSVNDINVIEKIIGTNYELDDGYLDVSGNLIPPSGNKEVTTSLIPVMAGQIMNVTIEYNQIRNAWCAFCVYDANKTFIKRIADAQESTASKTWTYTVGGNIAYVRLSYRTFNDIKNISVFFDKSIFERLIPIEQNQNLSRKKYTHLMNRQGEGYGFPDNSIEGITSALNDGFLRLRVSIACTSDNIIYCTHSSEMKNNAASNCLKLDGTIYTENVSINDVTSDFINRLLYKNYIIPTLESVMSLVCAYDVELTLEMKEAFTATQAQTLIDMINYYRIPVVISGLNAEDQLQAIIGISTDMRLGIIFHYTDSSARYNINQFSDKCKTLRFDCFLNDTISRESVTGIIHPNYGLKLGGSNPSASEIKDFLKWVDVCETARPYSEFV